MQSLRAWLTIVLLIVSTFINSYVLAANSVPPNVGKYNYGFERCDYYHTGYATREQAEAEGANNYYDRGCGAHVTTQGPWATDEVAQGGVCGGFPVKPGRFLGVESSNQTNDLVTYLTGSKCTSSSRDGLTVGRSRSVACPFGYTANSKTNLCDPPAGIDPNKNNSDCPAGCNGSDPINSATGALLQREIDYVDPNGLLNLTRLYSSVTGQPLASGLGPQWRTDFDQSIGVATSGGVTAATAYRSSGDRLQFTLVGSTWTPDADVHLTLTSTVDGAGNYTSWTLVTEDGTTESYNGDGYLTQVTTRDQRTLIYTYDGIYLSKVTDDHGRSLVFLYASVPYKTTSSVKRIVQIQLPDGATINYSYDPIAALLAHVTYPANDDEEATTRSYIYAENGAPAAALTGITDEDGNRFSSWKYDAKGRAIMSAQGDFSASTNRTELSFTDNGASSTIKSWIGSSPAETAMRTFTFSIVQGVARLSGSSSSIDLPSAPHLPQAQTFNSAGSPLTSTDFNGAMSQMTYDANELQTQLVEAVGKAQQRTTNTTWDSALRLPVLRTIEDSTGKALLTQAWIYNSAGQVLAQCDIDVAVAPSYVCALAGTPPAGVRRILNTYCTNVTEGCPRAGLLLATDGPRTDISDITTYSYYPDSVSTDCANPGGACHQVGDLYQIKSATGQVTTYASYDADGRATRILAPNGAMTDQKYTARGWLKSTIVARATTSYVYNGTGQITKVTDPDGVYFTYRYDNAHRLIQITDPLGNYAEYILDAVGNRLAENTYDGSGTRIESLSRQFDTAGKLIRAVNAQGNTTTYGYDGNGNLTDITDAIGATTHYLFDALNRNIGSVQDYAGTAPSTANLTTTTAYDALDHLTSITDPDGISTKYTVNAFGNTTSTYSPNSGMTYLTYDAAGNLATRLDARGVTTLYAHDALSRITAINYPAHPELDISYTYDEVIPSNVCTGNNNVGHLTAMKDASGTTIWCYTPTGDVREIRQMIGGREYLQGFTQTAGRRPLTSRYPSGFTTALAYDAAGRVSSIGYTQQAGPYGDYASDTLIPLITSVSYQPFGAITGYSWAKGGQSQTFTRDGNGWVTDIASQTFNLHFTRGFSGLISSEGEVTSPNPSVESYQYDALGRLTGVTDGQDAIKQAFTYNGTGDRLSSSAAGKPASVLAYRLGTHQLISVGGLPRTSDATGNTTALTSPNGALIGLGYDDRNLVTVIQQNGLIVGRYQYNGRGERVLRDVTSPIVDRIAAVYDPTGSGNLIGEYANLNYREYVYLNGLPVASATDAGRAAPVMNYLHADHLGTLRSVTSEAGTPLWGWEWRNNSFGDKDGDGSDNYSFRFPGQYLDVESGLHYNGYRYYDPSTGRYLEQDPLGLAAGTDSYSYVESNPFSGTDPLGLFELVSSFNGLGSVWCDHGTWRPYVIVPNAYKACPIVGQCAYLHEESHIADVDKANPGLCHFWNPTIGGQWLAASNLIEQTNTELKAFEIELNCLENWLKQHQCDKNNCQWLVKFREGDIQNHQIPKVLAGSYGRP